MSLFLRASLIAMAMMMATVLGSLPASAQRGAGSRCPSSTRTKSHQFRSFLKFASSFRKA